ncbi:MAG TPA: DUF3108 domain-containing protein [Kiritimatiellia bacterium]|nr:DUF3108 domain-containing protein [Kiritimatiellia bacterium]
MRAIGWSLVAFWLGLLAGGAAEGDEFHERFTYDVRWAGISVGRAELDLRVSEEADERRSARRFSARTHGWVSKVKAVDTRIESIETVSEEGVIRQEVLKSMREGKFRQEDYLVIDGASRMAHWVDQISGEEASYEAPPGVLDYVSFLVSLRDAGVWKAEDPQLFRLLMDRGVHELELSVIGDEGRGGKSRMDARTRRLRVLSRSPDLFVRNVPREIRVCRESEVVVGLDASTRLGRVTLVLTEWIRNGETMEMPGSGIAATGTPVRKREG